MVWFRIRVRFEVGYIDSMKIRMIIRVKLGADIGVRVGVRVL